MGESGGSHGVEIQKRMTIVEKYDDYLNKHRDRLIKGELEAVLREAREYSGAEEWIAEPMHPFRSTRRE